MKEDIKQVIIERKETMTDFKKELIKRLKDDDRTRIYSNFIMVLDQVSLEVINDMCGGV